jgi:RHS repeat-associated protein
VGNRTSDSSTLAGVATVGLDSFNLDDWLARENYDANGNTTYTGGRSFVYDSENHMTTMTGNGETVSMIYDGFGNRVSKTANGVTTKYLVEDDVNPTGLPQVFEESVNGIVQRTYTYGLQRISEDQVINNAWTPSFYGYDGFGTVRQLTNLAGTVTDTYSYDAFGNQLNSTGTTPNNYLYRGEQFDPDLGLYYLRARYYNPATGRFMSRDPEDGILPDPMTLHKYDYAGGDPVNAWDPTGRTTATWDQVGGGDMGEYAGLIGAIAIATVPAVKALGCTIDIALSVEALRIPGSNMAAIKVDLPHCSANKDCTPFEEAIQQKMEMVQDRYNELLMDVHKLYGCRNNKNPWTQWGSWQGHIEAYENAQTDLEEAIIAAQDAGCPVPPEAYELVNQPAPSCPAN